MTLWVAIPLALLFLCLVLILSSSIKFHLRLCRRSKNDRLELDVTLLFGLVKLHYKLPELVFEGIERGVRVKLEENGIAPITSSTEKERQIDKETVTGWVENVKKAVKATKGLKKWLSSTLSHLQISKLDWTTDFSLGDAAVTATAAGALWGLKWSIAGMISQHVRLKRNPRLFVKPVFQDDLSFSSELLCAGKMSLAYMLYAGVQLLVRASRAPGGLKLWKELLSLSRKHRGKLG